MALLFRRLDFVYYSLLCNVLTNPVLNLILLVAVHLGGLACYYPVLVVLEITATTIEAYVLKLLCRFRYGKAIAVSCLLNLTSFVIGILCYGVLK